jgi:hypothetical protein
MDTLTVVADTVATAAASIDKNTILHMVWAAVGTLIPVIVGLVLPRKKTVQYGMAINKFLGSLMLQKRATKLPGNILQSLLHTIRTTFQDLSFGVYISSRQDLSKEEKQKKVEEYLALKYLDT